jgi:hypothetical protein
MSGLFVLAFVLWVGLMSTTVVYAVLTWRDANRGVFFGVNFKRMWLCSAGSWLALIGMLVNA